MTNTTAEKNRLAKERIEALKSLQTLPELLTHHLAIRADLPIYKIYDPMLKDWVTLDARSVYNTVQRWKHAFAALHLKRGDRVAMLLPNCIDAIYFDQAALACALVPVPLHAIDTPGSSSYILKDAGVRVLFTNSLKKWKAIEEIGALPDLKYVVITDEAVSPQQTGNISVTNIDAWLQAGMGSALPKGPKPDDLAALVYTSGTTGNPKGVMLTHRAILSNIVGVLGTIWPYVDDVWLSFLPLSHTFERTTSYYIALGMGNLVAFNRGIGQLQDDMRMIRPTLMMSVPRVYEKIYAKVYDRLAQKSAFTRFMMHWAIEVGYRRFCAHNGMPTPFEFSQLLDPLVVGFLDRFVGQTVRNIFGGRPRILIAGGAAFSPDVSKFFLGLGVNIYQGYGLTETCPIVSVNAIGSNHPNTVGKALSNLRVRIGDNDELQVKGPSLMLGYWNQSKATQKVFTQDGWFKTGDQADLYSDGDIRIKGRIKEIIVTSTGEKISPVDMEQAIETDPLFSQAMLVGDNRPYIAALVVVNPQCWKQFISDMNLDPNDESVYNKSEVRSAVLRRIRAATNRFPKYGIPRNVRLLHEEWTIDNGMLTPTLKLKRREICKRYVLEIESLYGDMKTNR